MLYQNVLEMIGNTPIVKINKLNPNPDVGVYLKLEGQNPGGSIKDRIARAMIEAGEKSGKLAKDKIILEPTSGNTGIGLAMVAAYLGYRTALVMSEGMSQERRKILGAYGAEIILTPKEEGTDGAIRKAYGLVKAYPGKYWMPDQFANRANPETHFKTTAEEILRDVPDITHLVAGLGTSGTLLGIAGKIRQKRPEVKIIGVEPRLGHGIQGLKNMREAIRPEIYDPEALDEKTNVEDSETFDVVRRAAREEGLFLGMSSGAPLLVALRLAERLGTGQIVAISPDRGEKYVSTGLFG